MQGVRLLDRNDDDDDGANDDDDVDDDNDDGDSQHSHLVLGQSLYMHALQADR